MDCSEDVKKHAIVVALVGIAAGIFWVPALAHKLGNAYGIGNGMSLFLATTALVMLVGWVIRMASD